MDKLSKKRAAEIAGVSIYRLNKDIKSGRLKTLDNGVICSVSLQQLYTQVEERLVPTEIESIEGTGAGRRHLDPQHQAIDAGSAGVAQQKRWIGKLQALLSLAERHRLMIEQQRRNLAMLRAINQRQEREIDFLRAQLKQLEQNGSQRWRRLMDRFSRMQST